MYYRLYFIYIICQWYLISLCYSNTSPELVRIEEYIAILTDQLTEDVTNPQLWAEIAAARHEYTHFSNIYKYNNSNITSEESAYVINCFLPYTIVKFGRC